MEDDSFLMCFNAHNEPLEFRMPARENVMHVDPGEEKQWNVILDTHQRHGVPDSERVLVAKDTLSVHGRSVVILQRSMDKEMI